jgi:hypothetical protein
MDLFSIHNLLANWVTYSELGIAVFALFYATYFKGFYKYLFINILITASIQLFNNYLVNSHYPNTQFVNYIYMFLEVITIGLFYYSAIQNSTIKKWFLAIVSTFLIYILFVAFYKKGYLELPAKTALIEMQLFTVISIYIFYELSQPSIINKKKSKPLFYFNLFILISYFSSTLFFIFIDIAYKASQNLYWILYIIKNAIGLLCYSIWIYATLKLKTAKPTATPKP